MRAGLAKPITRVGGVRFLAMHNAVPERPLRCLNRLSHFMRLVHTREVKVESTQRGTRLPRIREQPFRGERSEEHTSELQSLRHLVCRLLLEKKKTHP